MAVGILSLDSLESHLLSPHQEVMAGPHTVPAGLLHDLSLWDG